MKNVVRKLKKTLILGTLRGNQGFTLTEMLIVIALIALVGTFVTTNVISRYNNAKISATKTQIRQLGVILDDFRRECGFYPLTDQGLDALVHKPTGGRECKNYDPEGYIKGGKLPKDGFGNDFIYTSDGNKYEIKSLGNDGKEGGEGLDKDISSADLDG
jgi:general secretion pathway protein G